VETLIRAAAFATQTVIATALPIFQQFFVLFRLKNARNLKHCKALESRFEWLAMDCGNHGPGSYPSLK